MSSTLKGRTALITGGAVRIGKEIALALAREGVNLIIHYNKANREAQNTVNILKKHRIKAEKIKADFSKPKQVEKLFDKIKEKKIKIDILINNAAIFYPSTFRNIESEEFIKTYLINAYTPLALSKFFAKQTIKGDIINILDSRIKGINKKYLTYSLSKKTLHDITKLLAVELAPSIKVNAIAPGLILAQKDDNWDKSKLYNKRTLLKKKGKIADIIYGIMFLLKNPFITGETIFIDGGQKLISNIYGL